MTTQDYSDLKENAKQPTFEENLSALEDVVTKLEREDLTLEQLINEFEKGVELLKQCRHYLQNAKGRIDQYIEEVDGQWRLKEFKAD